MLRATASLIAILVWTAVRAEISNDIAFDVICTTTGFLPTFNISYNENQIIAFEVHIGGIKNVQSGAGGMCNWAINPISNTSYTIDVNGLNSGNEIPYMNDGNPICNGALEYSTDNSTIDYRTQVVIVVTETIRGTLKRQKRFSLELKCYLRRDVTLISSTSYTIESNLTAIDGKDKATDLFELSIKLIQIILQQMN